MIYMAPMRLRFPLYPDEYLNKAHPHLISKDICFNGLTGCKGKNVDNDQLASSEAN